jgi:succinate dehydrogenase / fumarate reductase cytochrome b subunit
MNSENKFRGLVKDVSMNKNLGNFAYWVHRITGIGLAVYLLMHLYVLSSAISGPESFSSRMGRVQSPLFAAMELLLLAGVFLHMLNGLRITLSDFFAWSRYHKLFFWLVLILFAALMIAAVILQWPKFNPANYGTEG